MPRFLIAALALLLLVAPSAAPAQTSGQGGKLQVLLLPLKIDLEKPDGFESLDPYQFFQMLEQKAEQANSQVDLVIPGPGDPRLANFDLTVEPDPAAAVAEAHLFDVPVVAWTKIQFRLQHQVTQPTSGDVPGQQLQVGDPAPQNLITVGGIAHMGIVDVATGKVLMQGPVAIFRSGLTRANVGTGNFQDDVRDVTMQCAEDLAARIVEVAQKRRASAK